MGFSLHPVSWQLWLILLVYLTVSWYQHNSLFSTSSSESEHYWLAFSNVWISIYILFLLYKVQLPYLTRLLTVILLSPCPRILQSAAQDEMCRGLSRAQRLSHIFYTDTNYMKTGDRCGQLLLLAISICLLSVSRASILSGQNFKVKYTFDHDIHTHMYDNLALPCNVWIVGL